MTKEEIMALDLKGVEARKKEITALVNDPEADIDARALSEEIDLLEERAQAIKAEIELRNKIAAGDAAGAQTRNLEGEIGGKAMTEMEKRAAEFVKSGKTETRAVLSTGTIATPTKADGVNGLAEVASDIVDDVKAIPLQGNGAYTVGYKVTDAATADVTDGETIGGTGATFGTVTINPAEWGVLDTVSNQVKKMTPVNYLSEVEASALGALRNTASEKIVDAVQASSLAEFKYSVTLDATYVRNLVLNFRSIKNKGNVVLYIAQADLATLGSVRGTNEKKACYEIAFDAGTTLSGTIKDGGTAVRFRVLDSLTTGIQLFGQPQTIEMPMWDGYEISTDEGGEYFAKNLIAVKGLQTAGCDLCAYHGMQVISQAAES